MISTLLELARIFIRLYPGPWLKLRLWGMGCRNIRVNGVCWSFDHPKNKRWLVNEPRGRFCGGSGAVKNYIKSGGLGSPRPRNPIRLAIDHEPIWTIYNGG